MGGNEKKAFQLGMPIGTANHRLRKMVLFHLMQKCNMDDCYQCGYKIDNIDDLSIEHKIKWLDSENPVELYFDINNIAFSHLTCNVADSKRSTGKITVPCPSYTAYQRGCRCQGCKDANAARKRLERQNR